MKKLTNLYTTLGIALFVASPLFAHSHTRDRCSWWNPWACDGDTSGGGNPPPTSSVPEIDASTGLLAAVVVIAVLALVWERRRRNAA